jgi:hypothetical protein
MMLEKEIDEIGRIGRSRKQNENGVESRKVEDKLRKVRRDPEDGSHDRGISRNVEADG